MVSRVSSHPGRSTISPLTIATRSIIGAGLGGCLAEPVKNYPNVFAKNTIFETFPFLLPNLLCAFVVLFSLIIGILFLDETHGKKKDRRDYGRELGSWLVSRLLGDCTQEPVYSKLSEVEHEEAQALMQDDSPPGYSSVESSPRLTPSRRHSITQEDRSPLAEEFEPHAPHQATRSAFTKQVILHIIAYGILAFHTISFEQLMPVLLSSKESDSSPSLPFKFEGGYELPSSEVGFVLSLQGVYQMFAQMIVFPLVVNKLGALRTFRFVAVSWGFLYILVPYLVLLPDALRMPGLAVVLIIKVTLQSLSYPSNALLLANSAPSLLVLGAINGVAASAASLCRAFGPTLSGLIASAGASKGYIGLAWWVSAGVAFLGAVECFYMSEPAGRPDLAGKAQPQMASAEQAEEPLPVRLSSETGCSDATLVQEEAMAAEGERLASKR